MSIKTTILNQMTVAAKQREAMDGETITFPGAVGAKIGVFSAIEDPFQTEEVGTRQQEKLQATLRIDQFLADPTLYDPAVDYRGTLPARTVKVLLRGRTWRIEGTPTTSHLSWQFTLAETHPRA